ncbi:hypothetical protein AGMMS50293_30060 [Spirochaetia bacterium]|nr:hypothetical protein AGMMS50293_30060 [Spirochaetia bacterium]
MRIIEKYPEIENEFSSEMNPNISIYEIGIGSTKRIWWKCKMNDDHVWPASPNQRTSGGSLRGCPICAGKIVVASNSLKVNFPLIAEEWHPIKNGTLRPLDVTSCSNKKVWWQCRKNIGHEWIASPKQRTRQNNTCPYCNSLAVRFPEIAKQVHLALNNEIEINTIPYSSHLKIWWKCDQGFDHIWQATINSRTSMNLGCPICSGYKVTKSNSLSFVFPELALEWDYEKNEMNPDHIYCRSSKVVWWKCPEGDDHRWKAQIKSRANGNGCPICSGRKVTKSNSLATKYPEIAKIWNIPKNKNISPLEVTPFSNKKVWWKCPVGDNHEWKATVANVVNGTTCPVCMGRKITLTNNLAVLFPKLIEEWDFKRNALNPHSLSPGSKEKAWWICSRNCEHIWFSTIKDRTSKDSGCPFCSIKLNVAETKMLDIIKELLPKYEILYRYKPKWLNRMELDVYVPELKLGFEYQGIQHFKPVDFFGGKETFLEQVKRDKLKKQICKEKQIELIEIYYDEKLSISLIRNKIINAGIFVKNNF